MDCRKIGSLIKKLRTEQNMTQLDLAQKLDVTDRAVSKWERGEGCPDITLVSKLSSLLGVSTRSLLEGALSENDLDKGNMKKIKFYVCPTCGNIITSTGEAEISCCGKKIQELKVVPCNKEHLLNISDSNDELYVTFSHEMEKEHFIAFVAYVSLDKVFIQRLYPEQSPEFLMPKMQGCSFYIYCNKHGLFLQKQ